jgi:hypothetical protein
MSNKIGNVNGDLLLNKEIKGFVPSDVANEIVNEIKIKEINIYDNDRNNGFTLAGNLVKYSVDMATRYGLNEKYAYDYVKPNIRQKNISSISNYKET